MPRCPSPPFLAIYLKIGTSINVSLALSKELAASSDSDLLKSAPPWTAAYLKPKLRLSPDKDQSFSDSSHTTSSHEVEEGAPGSVW